MLAWATRRIQHPAVSKIKTNNGFIIAPLTPSSKVSIEGSNLTAVMWGSSSSEPPKIDKSEIGGFVSAKLNKMSMEERSSGLHDLHGVADRISESPEMVRAKSQEMSNILSSIADVGADESSAYRKAVAVSPDYG
jgi:hypothetical protein